MGVQQYDKRYFSGTHRAASPEETWQKIQPLLPLFGVTRVADITGLDRIGIPVAVAIRPSSRSVVVSAGKGLTLAAAKVSAAMESLECAHAETISSPLHFGSRSELAKSYRVVDTSTLPLLRGKAPGHHTRIVWATGRSIDDEVPVLVPYELVHAHYDRHGVPGSGIFQATTNGLSSGNTMAEAISHGLFEVIERDSLNLWERGTQEERDATRLDLNFRDQGGAWRLIDRLAERKFAVAVWNISSTLGVPAFHCVILDESDQSGHPGTGTGCHPDKSVALSRAVTEAIQVRATYISGGRDDLMRHEYDMQHLELFRRMLGKGVKPATASFDAVPSQTRRRFEDDIAWAADRIRLAGCGPVIVVDLSAPDTGVNVVRVIVPGMEGPPGPELSDGSRARSIRA